MTKPLARLVLITSTIPPSHPASARCRGRPPRAVARCLPAPSHAPVSSAHAHRRSPCKRCLTCTKAVVSHPTTTNTACVAPARSLPVCAVSSAQKEPAARSATHHSALLFQPIPMPPRLFATPPTVPTHPEPQTPLQPPVPSLPENDFQTQLHQLLHDINDAQDLNPLRPRILAALHRALQMATHHRFRALMLALELSTLQQRHRLEMDLLSREVLLLRSAERTTPLHLLPPAPPPLQPLLLPPPLRLPQHLRLPFQPTVQHPRTRLQTRALRGKPATSKFKLERPRGQVLPALPLEPAALETMLRVFYLHKGFHERKRKAGRSGT